MNKKTNPGLKIICLNRKASFNYFFEDLFEAGIVLKGSEIKSVRDGKVNIAESYAVEKGGEIVLINSHISPYKQASYSNHNPIDDRKLLLNKKEINTLIGIVYAPAIKRLFYAGKTFGSFEENKDGIKKIRIRKSDKNKIVAVASSSHLDQKTKDWLVKNNIARTVSIGSSLKFCLVASGEADVYPRFGPTMEWDTAAGDAVLRYAGGRVEYLDGSKFTYGKKNFKNTPFIAKGDF